MHAEKKQVLSWHSENGYGATKPMTMQIHYPIVSTIQGTKEKPSSATGCSKTTFVNLTSNAVSIRRHFLSRRTISLYKINRKSSPFIKYNLTF